MNLSHQECLSWYQGAIDFLVVREDGGKRIQIPVNRFRPYVTTIGIRGRFRLTLDDNNKFLSLERLN